MEIKSKNFQNRLPDKVEISNAAQIKRIIESQLRESDSLDLVLAVDNSNFEKISLSPSIAQSLLELLNHVSSGNGIILFPVESELTTQQAADILNVSRTYLKSLLNDGKIPYKQKGRHKKILASELFRFKQEHDKACSESMNKLIEMDGKLI